MTDTNTYFDDSLPVTLVYEGAFSDNPHDPGGRTMKGITQHVYDAFRDLNKQPRQDVKLITNPELYTIYQAQYWDKVEGDNLPPGLDLAVFDFAVNSGPEQAVKVLQRLVKVDDDGIMGMRTVAAINAFEDTEDLITSYSDARLAFMSKLKNWQNFKDGWTTRVKGIEDHAVKMYLHSQDEGHPAPTVPVAASAKTGDRPDYQAALTPKADPSTTQMIKTPSGIAAAAAAVTAAAPIVLETASALSPYIGHDLTAQVTTGVGAVVAVAGAATALYNIFKPFLKTV